MDLDSERMRELTADHREEAAKAAMRSDGCQGAGRVLENPDAELQLSSGSLLGM